jgi:hypothetical protein
VRTNGPNPTAAYQCFWASMTRAETICAEQGGACSIKKRNKVPTFLSVSESFLEPKKRMI